MEVDEAGPEVDRAVPPPSAIPAPSGEQPVIGETVGEWFVRRAQYIPLRLTPDERKFLRLLEGALTVSEYTNKVRACFVIVIRMS
jgi:hypothetical protein